MANISIPVRLSAVFRLEEVHYITKTEPNITKGTLRMERNTAKGLNTTRTVW